jgi:hypothetical protein
VSGRRDANTYTDSDGHPYGYRATNRNSVADAQWNPNCYTNRHSDPDRFPQSDAETSSDTASSANTAVIKRIRSKNFVLLIITIL